MATYFSSTRTNYFECKDPDALKRLCALVDCEARVNVFTHAGEDGVLRYGFGANNSINGITEVAMEAYRKGRGHLTDKEIKEYEDDQASYADFCEELQKLVMPGDACIIMESGHETLRYVTGYATVITSDDIKYINLSNSAKELARQMLNNPEYDTQMEY